MERSEVDQLCAPGARASEGARSTAAGEPANLWPLGVVRKRQSLSSPRNRNLPTIQDTAEGAILTVHVQPKACRTESVGLYGDALKVRVAAPPVEGAANDELSRFLAKQVGVPPSAVVIRAGVGSRHKKVLLKGVSSQRVRSVFNL